MQAPARLPATVADLDEWSVYADWLQTQGDPRGELIARDLALPETPAREQLAVFHELTGRHCKPGRTAQIGWCVGHVRTLQLIGAARVMMRPSGPDGGTLTYAHQLLLTPLGRRLEELAVPYAPYGERVHWRRVLANLPPACRRVQLSLSGAWRAADCDALIAMLPATVDELALAIARPARGEVEIGPFVTDRFAIVDLAHAGLRPQAMAALEAALASSSRVRVRSERLEVARALGWDRVVIGSPRAAGLIAVDHDAFCVFEPWSLLARQQRYGVVGVRAQLADAVPEDHGLDARADALVTSPGFREGLHLVRRGTQWTLRGTERYRLRHRGRSIERGAIVELAGGDALAIEVLGADGAVAHRIECRFVARDFDAACRRRFA